MSFPTGLRVDKSIDEEYPPQPAPLGDIDKRVRATCKLPKTLTPVIANVELDSPEATDGMPISLQLVAGRLREERLLAMTKMVLSAIESHS